MIETTSIASPLLWALTIAAIVALFLLDFAITHKPHAVSFREALAWSGFYLGLPLAFGVWIWLTFGSQTGMDFYAGYLVEKSLSVDNLFVFMLLLSAFAVPRELQQRVLLIGVAGALILRGVFIALGAAMLANFTWTFLLFGAILLATAVKVLRDTLSPSEHEIDPSKLRIVKLARKLLPVTDNYHGPKLSIVQQGRRALTPLALATLAVLTTDIIFAVDSVPAVYGITGDAYLVFATNAFALLGLRALYFVLEGALGALVHLGYGLAAILAFIGAKLMLHWAHGIWGQVPTVPTSASLIVIVAILALVVVTSLLANRHRNAESPSSTQLDNPLNNRDDHQQAEHG
jgi:tellurite resistance protein TerC